MKHNLEMIVDQPMAGHFYWTIVEVGQAGEAHRVVAHAPGPLPTCSTATGAGLVALLQQPAPEGASRERRGAPSSAMSRVRRYARKSGQDFVAAQR
jgi:hypothetical protein